ncbi:MAG: hypothetical protein K2P99_06125 [Burkholderiales bacterium]|nr:hypothetical protein [Burkholderiales bacterium]
MLLLHRSLSHLRSRQRLIITQLTGLAFITLATGSCAFWQKNPTPSTLDNSVYNQDSQNLILHSVSNAVGSTLLDQGTYGDNYVAVYAITLKNKPAAVSVMSTAANSTYFINILRSPDMSNNLFAANTDIIHSTTTVTDVSYNDIKNATAKKYIASLGFNEKTRFLKRSTNFYKDNQTLTMNDYLLPQKAESSK